MVHYTTPTRLACDWSSVVQEESSYEGSSDVRAQLRFFEQLDQLEKQRKEGQERQILLKAAKVTSPPTRVI